MNKFILLLLILLTSQGYTQEKKYKFSLQEAIKFAVANNRHAKNATRDIEAAKQQKWQTTALGLPQINAGINYQNFLKQQVSVIPNSAFDNRQATINLVNDFFIVNQDPSAVLKPAEGFQELIFGTKQNINTTIRLDQLIFDGSYLVALQSAKVFLEISRNAKTKTDLEIRKAVINAYGNVLFSEESVGIIGSNIAVLEKNVYETTKIYNNGLVEQERVEQLQITRSNLQSKLHNAKRLSNIAYQMLNITLGIPFDTTTILTDNLETLAINNIDLKVFDKFYEVSSTIDYRIAENDKKSNELLLKLEKSKALPSLRVYMDGGYLGFSDEFTFLNSNQNWAGFSSFGFNLNIPIFSSGQRSAASQRARINLAKAQDNLTEIEQKLNLQIQSAKSNYKFAVEEYSIKKQNLELAERIKKKNQTKFFEGIATSFELRQAQIQLYAAQQELLLAMLNIITSKVELETITNTID